MLNIGYYNGEMGPLEEMKVPMLDRVSFYGDGIYDATMTCDGVIIYLEDHVDRFFNSMEMMRFQPDFTKEELVAELQKVVDAFDGKDGFLYWQVTRGTGYRQHEFLDCPPNLWIFMIPKKCDDLSGSFDLITYPDTRFLHCNAKTLNLMVNVLAAQTAKEAGCQEAVLVRPGDIVTETAHSNIHIIKDGVVITHPADNFILPGIARKHMIMQCEKLGIPVEEREFTVAEMMDADEIFISSSTTLAMRAATIDGKPVGGKARELHQKLVDAINKEFDDYVAANRK